MSDIKVRNLNSFGFPGGFNITNNEPIDSRTKVIDITHIYEVKNWEDVKPYTGLIVTDDYGNSYMCINSSQNIDPKTNKPIFCSESSWIPFGKLSDQYSPEISYSKLIGLSAYGAFTMYTELVNARNNADDKIIASYKDADSKIISSYQAADAAIIGKDTDADTALTIYGVRKYAVTNCTNLQNTINNKLSWCAVTGHKSTTTNKSPVLT